MAERPFDIPPGTRGPGYARAPAHRIAFVPRHARVRVAAAGTAIAKTSDVVAVEENGYPPRYYLARDGVDMTRVEKTGKTTYCPFKGLATYYIIRGAAGEIPYSLYRMFRHMAAVRLRLMWKAGVRSWLDPVQLGGLLKSLTWAAVGALGKRSLKRSGLTRRLFAPGRDDARPRFASAHPSRPEFTR